jgi:hypothetical protein
MTIARWNPPTAVSRQEQFILKRLQRTRKLFAFLRRHRHELFDDAFQQELASMYRDTGAGKDAKPPALMAMALLLQGYLGTSDAEAVELTLMDLRWQMVLDRLGATEPAFCQGALQSFRERLIAADLDRRLLERTLELAKKTGSFDPKKLPKTLRIAIDSSPLEGAGRVEDTFNLLGHAARKVVECVAQLLELSVEQVCRRAGIPVLMVSSIKKGLDTDWSDPQAKQDALQELLSQLDSLKAWLSKRPETLNEPELKKHIAVLEQIAAQDLEPDPDTPKGKRRLRIRKGVAPDRRVSVEDGDMRHGRKSKTKAFNGYKRHVASVLDVPLIMACAVTPANKPEQEAAEPLRDDIARQGHVIGELHIDRGYINAPLVDQVLERSGKVLCKPWRHQNKRGQLFSKTDFHIDLRQLTITCPAGETEVFEPGTLVEFDPDVCDACPLRNRCTLSSVGHGRTVTINDNESLQRDLRVLQHTSTGRQKLRQRVGVEHRLAHISQRQGRRARYLGLRKNLFDLRRAATVQNLETIQREQLKQAA